jgi:hypothetical protein
MALFRHAEPSAECLLLGVMSDIGQHFVLQ